MGPRHRPLGIVTALLVSGGLVGCSPVKQSPEEASPVYMVISIHSHLDGDDKPTTAAGTQAVIDLVDSTRAVLEEHGFVANWQTSYGVADALCADPTGRDLLLALEAGGHEVGSHVHGAEWIDDADAGLTACGLEPRTLSGLAATTGGAADPATAAEDWLTTAVTNGYEATLTHLGDGRNPLDRVCAGTYGGTPYDPAAGNVPHAWRPDLAGGDVCAHAPAGPIAAATQTDFPGRDATTHDWDAYFATWRDWVAGVLDYAAGGPDQPVVWGMIWPFTANFDADGTPSDAFLAGLDAFLGDVEDEVAAGRIVPATGSDLVDLRLV